MTVNSPENGFVFLTFMLGLEDFDKTVRHRAWQILNIGIYETHESK